jgi:HK97 family phage portal protein
MGWFRRSPKTAVKGVDISYSDEQNFQRNLVSVRTVTYSGGYPSSSYSMLYRRQPAVRAAVDFLARNIGQLNPKVYERVSDTDRIEVSDHPLAEVLRHPNPTTTRYRHQRDTVADMAIYDRAYWWKMRSGRQLAIVRVPPVNINYEPTNGTYWLSNGQPIDRRDLVVFPGYSPEGDGEGVPPLETLRQVLAEEMAAVENRAGMWRNATRQSGVIERPADAPEWSDTARERFRTDMENHFTGSQNAGRVPVFEEGMKWKPDSFEPPTGDYIAGRRLTYEEAAIAYGIPPSILGMTSETKANAEQFHRQVYQDVLGPWLRLIQDEIELQLLPEFEPLGRSGTYVEFNLAEKLKGSFEEQGKALVTAVGVPYMSVNEGRARLNLSQIDEQWANNPVQPLNVLYGGQPAVTVPTADPGTAAIGPPQVKAAPRGAIRRRDLAAQEHQEFFERYFERQRKSLLGKAATDRDRWDSELTADLYLLATTTARRNGRLAAQQLDGVYDEPRTLPYLAENARITAEGINAHTFDLLDAAEDAEERADVFTLAKGARSEQLGLGRATMLIGFARNEAAKHSTSADGKRRTKTWVVTARNSRHPHMNGQTVPAGELFSNGMEYPHDGRNGGVGEVANCKCLLQIA